MSNLTAQRTDAYPSRVGDEPELLERRDPVVHGGTEGPLSAEQVSTFDSVGAVVLESLFSPAEVQAALDRLEELAADPTVRAADGTVTEPESHEVRSIFEIHLSDALMGSMATDGRVVDAASQLLGGGVYLHQSRINRKPGFEGKPFQWHSDFETWHTEDGMPRMRALSAAIALSDNHPFNGPLMIIPGSHRTFVTTVAETPEDNYKSSLKKQEVGVPDQESLTALTEAGGIEQMTGPAGSVVLFDCNVMHASAGNITPYPRSNLFLVFNSVDNELEEPFAAGEPRPNFIAAREVHPL